MSDQNNLIFNKSTKRHWMSSIGNNFSDDIGSIEGLAYIIGSVLVILIIILYLLIHWLSNLW